MGTRTAVQNDHGRPGAELADEQGARGSLRQVVALVRPRCRRDRVACSIRHDPLIRADRFR